MVVVVGGGVDPPPSRWWKIWSVSGARRIGSERLIFRPDIWRQDPQLHWYAIGFNTARSAAMCFFANSLD